MRGSWLLPRRRRHRVLAGDDVLLVGRHADLAVDVAHQAVRARLAGIAAVLRPGQQLVLAGGGVVGPEVVALGGEHELRRRVAPRVGDRQAADSASAAPPAQPTTRARMCPSRPT